MKIKTYLVTVALALLTSMVGAQTTTRNLNLAYQAESNSANRYRVFAEKAESENFRQAAKLFRAAAASEEIHRKIIERAIQKIGGRIETFKLDEITLGATSENLQKSIASETNESGTLYPAFFSNAKASKEKSAGRAFSYTLECDKKLAMNFQKALSVLANETAITCYVCGDCGLLLTQLPKAKCPVCREGVKKFKIIN